MNKVRPVETEELARELTSRSFKNEEEFENFINKRYDRNMRKIKLLKKYILDGKKPRKTSDWEEIKDLAEEASKYKVRDEYDLDCLLFEIVFLDGRDYNEFLHP